MDSGSGGWAGLSLLRKLDGYAIGDSVRQLVQNCLPEYRLLDEIQQGGQGVIYLAHQVGAERKVAVKVLAPTLEESHPAIREAKALGRIDHPNVVTIHSCGEAEGYAYIVMQYIDGQPIDEAPATLRASVRELAVMFAKVCRGVAAAHERNIMHCDIKPGNVLVTDDGTPHVLDFGLARLASPASPSSSATPGTLPWMSPEQLRYCDLDLDHRTDIYSLGVLFYWVLSAETPYGVERLADVTPEMIWHTEPSPLRFQPYVECDDDEDLADLPEARPQRVDRDLEMIILKALEKHPDNRYATASAMADDFERYTRNEAVTVEGMGWWYRLRKKLRRHRVVASIGLVLAVSAIGVAAAAVRSAHADQQAAAAKQDAAAAKQDVEAAKRDVQAARTEAETAKRQLEIANAALLMADLNAEGNKLRSEGETEKAAEAFEKALTVAAGFDNDEPEIRRREFGALYGLAEMYYFERRPERADARCRKAVELAERMYAGCREDVAEVLVWQTNVAYVRMLEGRAAVAQQRWADASISYRKAERARREALASRPEDVLARRRLAITIARLGGCERKLGHCQIAYDLLWEARGLHLQNAETQPDAEMHLVSLANVEISIANWHIVQAGAEHGSQAQAWLDQAELRLAKVMRLAADRDRNLEAIRTSRLLIEQRTE